MEESAIRNPQSAILRGVRVLVVDDEPDTLALIKFILDGGGAEVRTAESAVEVLVAFDDWKPGVIVSDIGMAGEDGYDFMRRVREREAERGGQSVDLILAVATKAGLPPPRRSNPAFVSTTSDGSPPTRGADGL